MNRHFSCVVSSENDAHRQWNKRFVVVFVILCQVNNIYATAAYQELVCNWTFTRYWKCSLPSIEECRREKEKHRNGMKNTFVCVYKYIRVDQKYILWLVNFLGDTREYWILFIFTKNVEVSARNPNVNPYRKRTDLQTSHFHGQYQPYSR